MKVHLDRLGDDGDAGQRAEANLVRYYGTRAIDDLIDLCADPNPTVRYRAAWALGKIGDARAFETVLALIDDPDERVQYDATLALGKLADPRAVDILVARLIKDTTGAVAFALVKLGTLARKKLAPWLDDPRSDHRLAALTVLGHLEDVDLVRPLADDPDPFVREEAAYWLELSSGSPPAPAPG